MTFDEIMAPLGPEAFTRDYLGQQPLHLQGPADKFQAVMNWEVLNRSPGHDARSGPTRPCCSSWTRRPCRPRAYAPPVAGRDGGTVLQPGPGAGAAAPRPRRHHGPELHRPADARSSPPSARSLEERPRRHGPGQPLSLVQAQAGLQGALRLPRRVRDARHGREDLDRSSRAGPTTRSSIRCSRAGRASGTSR